MRFGICTYNIKFSSLIFEREISFVAKCLNADIICMQEFPLVKLEQWKGILKEYGYRDFLAQKTCETLLGIEQANIMFSKFKLVDKKSVDLTFRDHEARKAQYCLAQIHGKEVFILHTHLGLRRKERLFQMDKINSILKLHGPEERMILLGDLNDWNGAGQKVLQGSFDQEAHTHVYGESAKSFPARIPLFRLDRIYYKNLALKSCHLLNNRFIRKKSDHLPLRACFTF